MKHLSLTDKEAVIVLAALVDFKCFMRTDEKGIVQKVASTEGREGNARIADSLIESLKDYIV